jgi:hypothetical protein
MTHSREWKNLAELSKECSGSRTAVLPMMVMVVPNYKI